MPPTTEAKTYALRVVRSWSVGVHDCSPTSFRTWSGWVLDIHGHRWTVSEQATVETTIETAPSRLAPELRAAERLLAVSFAP